MRRCPGPNCTPVEMPGDLNFCEHRPRCQNGWIPDEPKKEFGDDINWDRVDLQTQRILAEFVDRRIPPLESIAITLRLHEIIVEGMLDKSAHGKFDYNKRGLLQPMEKSYERLDNRQPPAGYIA